MLKFLKQLFFPTIPNDGILYDGTISPGQLVLDTAGNMTVAVAVQKLPNLADWILLPATLADTMYFPVHPKFLRDKLLYREKWEAENHAFSAASKKAKEKYQRTRKGSRPFKGVVSQSTQEHDAIKASDFANMRKVREGKSENKNLQN